MNDSFLTELHTHIIVGATFDAMEIVILISRRHGVRGGLARIRGYKCPQSVVFPRRSLITNITYSLSEGDFRFHNVCTLVTLSC